MVAWVGLFLGGMGETHGCTRRERTRRIWFVHKGSVPIHGLQSGLKKNKLFLGSGSFLPKEEDEVFMFFYLKKRISLKINRFFS